MGPNDTTPAATPNTPDAPPAAGADEVADLAGAEEIARALLAAADEPEAPVDDAPPAGQTPGTPPAGQPATPAGQQPPPPDDGLAELERIALERRQRADQSRRRPGQAPAGQAAPAGQQPPPAAAPAQAADPAAAVANEIRRRLADGNTLLDTLDELGFSQEQVRDLYVSIRNAAANPQPRARRASAAPAAPPITADTVQQAVQKALETREQAAERQQAEAEQAEAEAQQAEAQAAFARLTGDAERFPLLSDESPADRAARGTRIARKLVGEGKGATFEEIASAAEAELEQETLRRHARISGRAAGGASGQGKAGDEGATQRQGQRSKPRTLSADLASQRSAPPQSYPDGIEPEELRFRAAMEIAERGLER